MAEGTDSGFNVRGQIGFLRKPESRHGPCSETSFAVGRPIL